MEQKKLSPLGIVCLSLAGVVLLAVIGIFVWLLIMGNQRSIYPNVYVAGVNVGGMSESKAEAALDEYLTDTYGSQDLVVELPDGESFTITASELGLSMDIETAAQSAQKYGKTGSLLQRVKSYRQAKKTDPAYVVSAGITINEESVRAAIEAFSATITTEPTQCTYSLNTEGDTITVKTGKNGRTLDVDAVYSAVEAAVQANNFEPVQVEYLPVLYTAPDLTDLYRQVYVEMTDAYYDEDTNEIVPEQIGYGFDVDALNQQIVLANENTTIVVPLTEVQPNVTKEDLEEIYFADVIGSFHTSGLGGSNRANNITIACATINGVVVGPGEVFSYNQTLGQRTEEKGYKPAGAYLNGKSVTELGGGICQVSSTLYNAVLLANLEIVARSEHTYAASYVSLGLDATVSWGGPDFQFRNNTDYPIRIEAYVSNGTIYTNLIGTSTGVTVKMTYQVLATIPYTTTVTDDKEEVNDRGRTGYNVVSYRNVYSEDGELISSTIEAYSYYQSQDIVVLQEDLDKQIEEEKQKQEEEEKKKQEEEGTAATGDSTEPAAGNAEVTPG